MRSSHGSRSRPAAERDAVAPASERSPDGKSPGSTRFHLFVYGTLRSGGGAVARLAGCERVAEATVAGVLYDLGDYPALMLYGSSPVHGEVWRCPGRLLSRLDEYEDIDGGLFRRIAVSAGGWPCWTYVAGPGLARRLSADRRVPDGRWRPRARS